jgi:membrane-bound lytic murein transglycosylase D
LADSLAAYNAGPGNINKAIRRAGRRKEKPIGKSVRFCHVKHKRMCPRLLLQRISCLTIRNTTCMQLHLVQHSTTDVDSVSIKQQVNFTQLEAVLGIPYDELAFLNPMYKMGVVPVSVTGTPFTLTLPNSQVGNFVMNEQKIYNYVNTDSTMMAMTVQQVQKTHTVKKGEHINSIEEVQMFCCK